MTSFDEQIACCSRCGVTSAQEVLASTDKSFRSRAGIALLPATCTFDVASEQRMSPAPDNRAQILRNRLTELANTSPTRELHYGRPTAADGCDGGTRATTYANKNNSLSA
jgi:hypothetical protein